MKSCSWTQACVGRDASGVRHLDKAKLPRNLQVLIAPMVAVSKQVRSLKAELRLQRIVEEEPKVQLLMTVPGVNVQSQPSLFRLSMTRIDLPMLIRSVPTSVSCHRRIALVIAADSEPSTADLGVALSVALTLRPPRWSTRIPVPARLSSRRSAAGERSARRRLRARSAAARTSTRPRTADAPT